jgi:AhpC/TSA family
MKYLFSFFIFSFIISSVVYGQVPAATIPGFQLYRADKSVFANKDLPKGKMRFFVFFDPQCDHCQHAIKTINKEYTALKKVAVFIIALNDHAKINSFITVYGPNLKTQKNVVFLQDKLNQFVTKFGPRKYPSMFLYSAKNKLLQYEDDPENIFKLLNIINKGDK